jgi:hypothetical protein
MMPKRQDKQTSEILAIFFFVSDEILIYAPIWRGVQGTKRVRPTGKAFDDILTGHHGASQYGRPAMRNKTEAIDGRSIIHHDSWTLNEN